VEAAVTTVQPAAAAKGVHVVKVLDPLAGVGVTGDPGRLQQVFWNLLSNAVKFTPQGGRVQVVLERVNSHVEIGISDTGQGISPDFLPHVFDRFRQEDAAANRAHGGLGLGLAIVRHLVELHGGTVHADSPGVGRGATFTVSLPTRVLRRDREAVVAYPTPAADSVFDCGRLHLDGVRVLVLDDEPDARELVRRLLVDCRAVATVAATTEEALALVRAEPFDVIVSDVGMPRQDGYAFIARLRGLEDELRLKRHPVIALTAYARAEDRSRLMLAGFQVHVAKPVEGGELLAVVANLAGRI
jgi:CheY-like chemotaxis protein